MNLLEKKYIFHKKMLFIKYISCDLMRNLPKQSITFDFLLRDCVLGIGVAFLGIILMINEKYFFPPDNLAKSKAKKICMKSEQSLFIFMHKAIVESPVLINFSKSILSNHRKWSFQSDGRNLIACASTHTYK